MISGKTRCVVAAVVGVASLLATQAAYAGCEPALEPAQDQWRLPYDPFVEDVARRTFDLLIVNRGDAACDGTLHLSLRGQAFGLSRNDGRGLIVYSVSEEQGGVDLTPRSGATARRLNKRPVHIDPGQRTLARFAFLVAPDNLLSAGIYSQEAFIGLEGGEGETLAERPVTLALQVASSAVMGLKGEFRRVGGVARIDLGELAAGTKPLAASLYVSSTAGYSVSVESANAGRLLIDGGGWSIDYQLALGSEAMNLATGDTVQVGSNQARNDEYPLSISIDDVAGKRAGRYTDVITFTVTAI
jgi:hypothetical protein